MAFSTQTRNEGKLEKKGKKVTNRKGKVEEPTVVGES